MPKISFSQTVTGQERKAIAAVIAQAINDTPKYAGPPSFAFTAGGWSVSKDSQVISPEMGMDGLSSVRTVLRALSSAGLNPNGNLRISVKGISESAATILSSVVKSKETLLMKALQTYEPFTVKQEGDELVFPLFSPTLYAERVCAYLTLALKLAEFAGTLKHSSATEKPADNEKYAMRCFLLRLGFIGEEYKEARKILLAPLEGNSAFKAIPAIREAAAE